jgi:hypothetical protein
MWKKPGPQGPPFPNFWSPSYLLDMLYLEIRKRKTVKSPLEHG